MVKELYPFKSNYLDLGGIRYHYLDEGEGEPVVMLHGNPTWSFYYRNLVKALRDSHRVVVPDHIGCGLSDKPDEKSYDYTLEQRVKDLETLLSHLGIKNNITLVVHDWGGMIGMAYAAKHPEAIRRFVILNTSGFRLPKTKRFPWPLWAIRNTPFGSFLVRGLNAFSLGAAAFCTETPLPREIRKAYLLPYNSWKNRVAVYHFVKDIPLKPEDPAYQVVSGVESSLDKFSDRPMLICWGKHDFVFDDHFLAEWVRRFPKAEVHYFKNAGHYVLEDAGDEIIPLVKEWIKKTS
jgi:pimeloyl-ACP methyl ester carboxylesterase